MSQPRNGTPGDVEEIHWPSLVAAISSISAVGIAIGLGLPLLSIILEKRGISSTLIGLNTAMAGVAAMAAAPITTRLAHKYGVAPTMLWAVLISALSALGFYYAQDFWMWFPLRFAFHGATTTLFILSEFWINAASPPSKRGFVLGIYATVLSLGFAAGPLLFSILGSDGIFPFLIGAGAILLAAIPIFIARDESPVLEEKPELHFMLSSLSSTIITCLGMASSFLCSVPANVRLTRSDLRTRGSTKPIAASYRYLVEKKVTYPAKCKATSRPLNNWPGIRMKRRSPYSAGLQMNPTCFRVFLR